MEIPGGRRGKADAGREILHEAAPAADSGEFVFSIHVII